MRRCSSLGHYIDLDDDSIPWILNHIDCFGRHARLNESITVVRFHGYSGDDQDDEVWDKVGKAISNLKALKILRVCTKYDEDEEEDESIPPDWEILARILSCVRQKIELDISSDVLVWDAEELKLFAQAIHGHPTITSFTDGGFFPTNSWMPCIRYWQHCLL
jgi:hypothetical protein